MCEQCYKAVVSVHSAVLAQCISDAVVTSVRSVARARSKSLIQTKQLK